MKAPRILIVATVLALVVASGAQAQTWTLISQGFSHIWELRGESPSDAATAVAIKFPKKQSLSTWFSVNAAVNAMVICHGLNIIPPAGALAPGGKIGKAIHRVIDANGQQVASTTTKGKGKKSCKPVAFAAGSTSYFIITTIKSITKSYDAGTTIIPSVNAFPGVMTSSSQAQAEITDEQLTAFLNEVRRYQESIRPAD